MTEDEELTLEWLAGAWDNLHPANASPALKARLAEIDARCKQSVAPVCREFRFLERIEWGAHLLYALPSIVCALWALQALSGFPIRWLTFAVAVGACLAFVLFYRHAVRNRTGLYHALALWRWHLEGEICRLRGQYRAEIAAAEAAESPIPPDHFAA